MQVQPKVQLLTYTPDPEQTIAAASRLCYSSANIDALLQKVGARDQAKFLTKLLEMGHMSPFEHASFTFAIEGVSRALLAQLTRHRIASFSVQSQRYVGQSGDHGFDYIVPKRILDLGDTAVAEFHAQMAQIDAWYQSWLEKVGDDGKEDARFVLPNACATRIMMTMNARELMHFFNLRCCNRAQWEIRAVAWDMLELAKQAAPALFASAGPACIAGGKCSEGGKTCGSIVEVRAEYQRRFIEHNDM